MLQYVQLFLVQASKMHMYTIYQVYCQEER